LQTEKPIGRHVEKKLFQKQNWNQIQPAIRGQDHHNHGYIYYNPAADEQDEANGSELFSVFLLRKGKESNGYQTEKNPKRINVVKLSEYECS